MCKFIGIEDLVANALIELIEKHDCRKIRMTDLMNYGAVVVRYLREKKQEEVVLLISKKYTNEAIRNYSDFFELEMQDDGDEYILLKDEKTAQDLRDHFRAYLSVNELIAFIDKESLAVLLSVK